MPWSNAYYGIVAILVKFWIRNFVVTPKWNANVTKKWYAKIERREASTRDAAENHKMWHWNGKCSKSRSNLHRWMKLNQYCIEWIRNCNHFPWAAYFWREEMWQVGRCTVFVLWKYCHFSLVFVTVATECLLRFYEFSLLHVWLEISIPSKFFIRHVAVNVTVSMKCWPYLGWCCRLAPTALQHIHFNISFTFTYRFRNSHTKKTNKKQQTTRTFKGNERTFVMNKFLVRWKFYAAQFLL